MFNKDNILTLINSLHTYSPKKRTIAITDFLIKESTNFNSSEMSAILKSFKDEQERRSEQGKHFSKKQSYAKPGFSEEFRGNNVCHGCGEIVCGTEKPTPAFMFKKRGTWKVWHADVNCFTNDWKHIMIKNKKFLDYIEKIKILAPIIENNNGFVIDDDYKSRI